jgi:large subunit ribosomal protein L10
MKRSEKEQLVVELRDKISSASALYYTDFTGLNVKRMTDLRRKLRAAGVEYVVIKNTLALRAVSESGLVSTKLKGPTGIVVSKDALLAAKVLTDFAKANDQKPEVKGGVYEGKEVDAAMVAKLAAIPPRDVLLSMLAGALQAPLGAMLGALEALKAEREGATATA